MRGGGRRVRRAPRRDRCADERRLDVERLGDVSHRRAARRDLGSGLEGVELEPGRPVLPGRPAQALRPRHRLGHVRLLHGRDQRRGGREPHRLLRERGRQRHRPGRVRQRRRPGLPRVLVLRGEPGHAEGARGRRRLRLRRAERRRGAGRHVHAARATALHVREAQLVDGQRVRLRLRELHARERRGDRDRGAVRAARRGSDRRAAAEARGRDRRR